MANIREGDFYRVWPRFGKQINFQWGEIRQDTRELHPLAVNEQIDITSNSKLPALAGLAFGEQDFRNKYRVFYDEANDAFKIQRNTGTVASPTWTDDLSIDESTGEITLLVPTPSKNTGDPSAAASKEYVDDHRFYINDLLDVDAPQSSEGKVLRFESGRWVAGDDKFLDLISDGVNVFGDVTELKFNNERFYLSSDPGGNPVANLKHDDEITFHIESPAVDNYFLIAHAWGTGIVEKVALVAGSGSATAAFYIRGDNEGGPGVSIDGLDPISVDTSKQTARATGNRQINEGDELILSIPSNSSSADLRGTVKIRPN